MDWDTELDNSSNTASKKPFFVVAEKENEKETFDWLKATFSQLYEDSRERISQARENLAKYRGKDKIRAKDHWDRDQRRISSLKKLIVNHLHDLTEVKVSQMTRFKPAVEVMPSNDEWNDRASAKVVSLLIKHIFYVNNIDSVVIQMQRHARIFGESYCFILWDKDKGDLDPVFVAAREQGIEEVQTKDGEIINTKEDRVNIGDLAYELEVPWRVFLHKTNSLETSEYCFRVSTRSVEELKREYPEKAKQIRKEDEIQIFDTDSMEDESLEDHCVVMSFWHKPTKFLPEGYHCTFTKHTMLEKSDDYPFSHAKLPFIRLTDLDIPDRLHGVSKYEMLLPLQAMYDNLTTLIAKNIWLMAHAKWVMPKGACKIEQLGNDHTVIQFQGPVAPQMVQSAPNSPEVYQFRDMIKQEMQTIMGSHGISRGNIPKGITASSALQFLNELENERSTTDIAKHGFLIRELATMSISIAGDYYEPDDGRMMRIVGKNNQYLIRSFDAAHLHKSYDVRIDLSTGLPEMKSAKMERTLEAMQRNPQMFSSERWEDLLELGAEEKRLSLATEAVKAADAENEDLLSGMQVPDPERFEDHLLHWESHTAFMQTRGFKDAPPEVRAAFEEHVMLTEKAMLEKAQMSPTFQSRLAMLKLFPLYHHVEFEAPQSAEQMDAVVQGQANRGDQITGMIPGQVQEQNPNLPPNQQL